MARILSSKPIPNSGLDSETSNEVFDLIDRFAGYGFNKSHAAAYAAISFQTAALKAHHPEQFFAAAMNLDLDSAADLAIFADELKARGLPLWQPSINQSRDVFTPIELARPLGGFRFGIAYALAGLRGVGRSVAADIVADRDEHGPFKDMDDFLARSGATAPKKALEALAKSGAFDLFGLGRAEALTRVQTRDMTTGSNQMSMFDMMDAAPAIEVTPLSPDEILDNEFDVLGHFMSQHPLDHLATRRFDEGFFFSDFVLNQSDKALRRIKMPAVVVDVDVRRTRAGGIMAALRLSDPEGTYEALAFDEGWKNIRQLARKKARLMITASVSERGSQRRLMIDGAEPLDTPRSAEKAQSRAA